MPEKKTFPSPSKKRELILQALYQQEISGDSNTEILKQLEERNKKFNLSELNEFLKGIKKNKKIIDKVIETNSKLNFKDIGQIEISILRSIIYEMMQKKIDRSVSLNEGVRLAKKYGQDSSYKFVNAVLDKYKS